MWSFVRKSSGPLAALLAVACLTLGTPPADAAAKANKQRKATGAIAGSVVHHKKAVSGAKVHLSHHHKHRTHATTRQTAAKHKKPTTANHKALHHVTTNSSGQFTLKKVHAGTHSVVAHKKHLGSGHAKATVTNGKTANVTIRIHKHHHNHSGVTSKKKA